MEGVKILNQEEILKTPDWVGICYVICGVILIVTIMLSIMFALINIDILFYASIVLLSLSYIGFLITGLSINKYKTIPSGRYKYEAIIDYTVPIVDIWDRYEVIDKHGDIWILEDKEESLCQ